MLFMDRCDRKVKLKYVITFCLIMLVFLLGGCSYTGSEPKSNEVVIANGEIIFEGVDTAFIQHVFISKDTERAYVIIGPIENDEKPYRLYSFSKTESGYGNKTEIQLPDGLLALTVFESSDGKTLYLSIVQEKEYLAYQDLVLKGNYDMLASSEGYTIKSAKADITNNELGDITYLDDINIDSCTTITDILDDNSLLILSKSSPYMPPSLYFAKYHNENYERSLLGNLEKSLFVDSAVMSEDEKIVVLAANGEEEEAGIVHLQLSIMRLVDGEWRAPELVCDVINGEDTYIRGLSISGDGSFIICKEYTNFNTSQFTAKINKYNLQEVMASKTKDMNTVVEPVFYSEEYEENLYSFVPRKKMGMNEKSGIYYEIFVRSFADSDGDGIGDLNGVTSKLDYIEELGVDGIWLMPIFKSSSYHGYDVDDFYSIHTDYGTEEDLKNLINEIHNRGMKIILDLPINHTSTSNVWFTMSREGADNQYSNFYRWVNEEDTDKYSVTDVSSWGSKVWHKSGNNYYYGIFSSAMPDLNYNNEEVREEIISVAKKWLGLGVDGYRLDAAMHIYGDHEFNGLKDNQEANIQWWNEFALALEEVNKDVYLVGEVWNGTDIMEEYVQPFDTKFNFSLQQHLVEALDKDNAVINDKNLAEWLQEVIITYQNVDANYIDGIFLENHDMSRIASVTDSEEKSKLAANILFTLPGNPFIYYGQELGMLGEGEDVESRTAFPWGDTEATTKEIESTGSEIATLSEQLLDEGSMYQHYKALIELRKNNSCLSERSYEALGVNNSAVMAYSRKQNQEIIYVIHNFSQNAVTLHMDEFMNGNILFVSKGKTTLSGATLTLDGYSSIVIRK